MKRLLLVLALIVFSSVPSFAAWTFIAGTSAGSTDTHDVTTGAINTTGADLIVFVTGRAFLSNGNISDNKGNTFTQITVGSSAFQSLIISYVVNPIVGTGHTFTFTETSATAFPSIAIAAFNGATDTPVDQSTNTPSGMGVTSQETGSITPSQNGVLLVSGWVAGADNPEPTVDNSFFVEEYTNFLAATHDNVALAWRTQVTAAAINPTWSWTNSSFNVAGIVSFLNQASSNPSGSFLFRIMGVGL